MHISLQHHEISVNLQYLQLQHIHFQKIQMEQVHRQKSRQETQQFAQK